LLTPAVTASTPSTPASHATRIKHIFFMLIKLSST
jgi:hypothetical protein